MGPSEAVVLGLLLGSLGAAVCGSHSLHYFMTGMTDPGPGMPQFVIVGCVDGELLWNYSSLGRTVRPIMGWLPQEDQEHWDAETKKARDVELDFYEFLGRLQVHYNKSGGSHTLQKMFGCDILEDGSIRGYDQYAFDGRDFLAFDMDTMTFTAADPVAEITKRRWEEEGTYAERWKHELGTVCVQNLRRYLEHGKAALKRREPQPNLIPIVAGAVVAIVAVIAAVVGLVVWKSKSGKEKKGYEAAPGHNGVSSGSATGIVWNGLRRDLCGWSGPSSLLDSRPGQYWVQHSLENPQAASWTARVITGLIVRFRVLTTIQIPASRKRRRTAYPRGPHGQRGKIRH
eukprot:XP_015150540.1 class I histocompatibility antigen, F10 alpha chain-like isoform X8 [Gallus gallus]